MSNNAFNPPEHIKSIAYENGIRVSSGRLATGTGNTGGYTFYPGPGPGPSSTNGNGHYPGSDCHEAHISDRIDLPLHVPPLSAYNLGSERDLLPPPAATTRSPLDGIHQPHFSEEPHSEEEDPEQVEESNVRIGDPHELIELLKARSACIIVGAGTSVALASGAEHKRLVTWRGFLDKLAETVSSLLDLPDSWLQQIREHLSKASSGPSPAPDLQVAAELIAEKCEGKDPFMRYNHLVFKILHGLKAEENSMLARSLDILGKLGDSPLLTTNYDVLLEDATGRFTLSIDDLLKAQRFHRVDPKTHPNPLDHHEQYVFHLHGLFYDDPEHKFVLTSREYAVTIDDFTVALKPVLIDAESGSTSGQPIVRSSIFLAGLANPSSVPASTSETHNTTRPRSRLSTYSTTNDGTVYEDTSSPSALQSPSAAHAVLGSPKQRPVASSFSHHPHQLDHPRTKKERRSSARSSSVGPLGGGGKSPTIRITDASEVPDTLHLSQTMPARRASPNPILPARMTMSSPSSSSTSFTVPRTGSDSGFGFTDHPPIPPRFASPPLHGRPTSPVPSSPASPSPRRSFGPSTAKPAGPGVGIGPALAFHRSMIFIGVGGTLQDVHFTSLFAALQEHNVFLHHNGLSRIKHYVLVKRSELDSVMDFVFLDSLGREVPAKELLVAIVYGESFEDLPFFLAGLAQKLQEEIEEIVAVEDRELAEAVKENLGLDETRHHAVGVNAIS